MTDAQTMKASVAAIVRERLAHLEPLRIAGNKQTHPGYTLLREALNDAEQQLRTLITGDEVEVHEWLAVIHYALADERARLLS